MRYAIFSDLHANLQAWEAVRADMERQRIDVHVCLGDVVGYGPRPQEVLESVYEVTQNFVLGNHDAVIGGKLDPEIFNDHAREIIMWTNDHLNEDARLFFAEVPFTIEGAGFLAVHAEAAQPGRFRYIVEAEDARESLDATKEQLIFVGHTHHPGRFEKTGRDIYKFGSDDFAVEEGKRYVVNTGSVGEPRTPDIHASYCIYDSFQKTVKFRKLPFDIEGYKRDLQEVGLPIHPYFLDVYESGEASVVHQPAELAMRRAPKIIDTSSGQRSQVVVKRGAGHESRSFSSAADSYKAMAAKQASGKGAALWITISLASAIVLGIGIYALVAGGGNPAIEGRDGSVAGGTGEERPDEKWDVPLGEIVRVPDGLSWKNLVVSGFKNLARDAKVSSDGFPADWGSKGEAALVDGDAETFLKKIEGKDNYRVALEFKTPTKFSALSLAGFAQHEDAPEDFAVFVDGKKLSEISGAQYSDNTLLVPLPEVTASKLELRISKAYAGSPAIREIGIYDWDLKEVAPVVSGVKTGEDTTGPARPVPPDPVDPSSAEVPEEIEAHLPKEGSSKQTFFIPIVGEGLATWHYTTTTPPANWMNVPFRVDGEWKSGFAGFGNGAPFKTRIKTPWKTPDLWMRTRFEVPPGKLDRKREWYLLLSHDDVCEVYLNGTKIFGPTSLSSEYVKAMMPDGVKNILREGVNTLAVHCKQETGDQFIDVGVVSSPVATAPPPAPATPDLAKNFGPDSLLANYRNLAEGATASRPDNHEIYGPAFGEGQMFDGNPATSWRAKPGAGPFQIQLEFEKEIELNAFSFAGVDGMGPKRIEITMGQTRLNVSGINPVQLLELKSAVKVKSLGFKVLEWNGGSPGLRELGIYMIDPKGAKSAEDPEKPKAPAGDSIVLKKGVNGYEGASDTRIALRTAPGTGQPSRGVNMGGQKRLSAGVIGGQVNRSLLRFDLAEKFPKDQKPGGAKLTLSVASGANGQKVDLYLIHPKNSGWIEGAGTDASNQVEGGATWVSPNSGAGGGSGWFGGDGLGNPGRSGGYLSLAGEAPVCSGTVDGKKKIIEFNLPEEVINLWLEQPDKNAGILLRIPDENGEKDSNANFHSAESGDASKRPQLEISIKK